MKKEDVVVNEIMKELNWRERIVVRMFRKLFSVIYRKGMIDCFKYYNK